MDEIIQLISSVGFPIAMCAAMFYYIMRIEDAHKEEMNKLAEAVNNNTLAIQELIGKING